MPKGIQPVHLLAGGLVVGALVWVAFRGVKGMAADISGAAVDLVDGVVTGTVETVGEKIGIPKTNQTECERAKAEGRTWDASFACPAKDFLKYVFN